MASSVGASKVGSREGPAARPAPPPVSLGRVLIVEDNALIAMHLADTLAAAGADEVATCATVVAAMSELERLRPDVLVLDVHLADRDDGWTIAELVTQLGPIPPLIVFSTGTPESIPPAIADMGHVLAKPFPPADLVRLIRLHRNRPSLLARLRGALSF